MPQQYLAAFIISSFPLLILILLGNRQVTLPEIDFFLYNTWRDLHCANRIAMLLVGLFDGDVDGVDMGGTYGVVQAFANSSYELMLAHSSSIQSSWSGFLLFTWP